MNSTITNPGPQRGMALITVMIIFCIIATASIALLMRQQIDIKRTANILNFTQAKHYAFGAEELARLVLLEDVRLSPHIDYPGQHWSNMQEAMPISDGKVSIRVKDLQGLLNLNAVLANPKSQQQVLQRLLDTLAIKRDARSLIDGLNGLRNTPSDAAGILSAKQLALTGLTENEINTLLPYVTALPDPESRVNANTAPDNLLKALVINSKIYDSIKEVLARQGYITDGNFLQLPDARGIGVRSNYFQVRIHVTYNGNLLNLISVIHRYTDVSGVTHAYVISRDFGDL